MVKQYREPWQAWYSPSFQHSVCLNQVNKIGFAWKLVASEQATALYCDGVNSGSHSWWCCAMLFSGIPRAREEEEEGRGGGKHKCF